MSEKIDVQERITEYWDARGHAYDAQPGHGIWDAAERAAWLAALRGLLPSAPADVLDVGTGTGFLALLLAELGHRATGVDLAEGMLAEARIKAAALPPERRPTFAIGDAHAPPLAPSSVDALVSRHVLWTLADPARALDNWRALLRPGGTLVAIDGLWWAGRDPDESGSRDAEVWERWRRAYGADVRAGLPLMLAQTLDPIVRAVEAAGFADVRVSRLDEVERIERAASPERENGTPRYVVSARRPS